MKTVTTVDPRYSSTYYQQIHKKKKINPKYKTLTKILI